MGETKVVSEVAEGEFTCELREALALIAGKYGGTVVLPALGLTDELLRQINELMNPIGSRVRRDVWIGMVDGKRRMLDLLRFEPIDLHEQLRRHGEPHA